MFKISNQNFKIKAALFSKYVAEFKKFLWNHVFFYSFTLNGHILLCHKCLPV